MNQSLIALSLYVTPCLIANTPSYYYNTCCENSCCCESCCVPEPKPCIDCECYTPPFYDLQCDCGFFFDVSFLYWYARETNLSYALTIQAKERTYPNGVVTTPTLVFAPQKYNHLQTKWDPGVRVGIGYNSDCDGWDYYLNWTYFSNNKKNTTSVPDYSLDSSENLAANGQQFLLNPWINASFHGINSNDPILTFDSVRAKWRFSFNAIDLELGRKYWLSRCFTMRPYLGLRGAWTNTKFRTTSSRQHTTSEGNIVDLTFKDSFKTRNWGVGLLGGFQPNFFFCENFILYGNVDFALLWGDFQVKKRENYTRLFCDRTGSIVIDTIDPSYTNQSTSKFAQMNAILDLALGLRWEETWCCNQYRTALDIGWEHHIWFDYNHRNKTFDFFNPPVGSTFQNDEEGFRSYAEATGNLGYGGLVIRARFEF